MTKARLFRPDYPRDPWTALKYLLVWCAAVLAIAGGYRLYMDLRPGRDAAERAHAALVAHDHDTALRLYGEALAEPGLSASERLKLLDERAILRRRMGDLPGAIADRTAAIELMPRSGRFRSERASLHLDAGRPEAALADLEEAIRRDGADAWLLEGRGRARAALGDPEGAVADLTESIRLEPGRYSAFAGRADALRQAGRPREAVADYARALELGPPGDFLRWRILAGRGAALVELGEPDRAMADLDAAAAIATRSAVPLEWRGRAHEAAGRPDRAREDYRGALALDPGNRRAAERLRALGG